MLPTKSNKPAFYYIVRLETDANGKQEEVEFSDGNPIVATKLALDFYTSSLKDIKPKEIEKKPVEETLSKRAKAVIAIYAAITYQNRGVVDSNIGIYLKMEEAFIHPKTGNKAQEYILIHGFCNANPLNANQILYGLRQEFDLYKKL